MRHSGSFGGKRANRAVRPDGRRASTRHTASVGHARPEFRGNAHPSLTVVVVRSTAPMTAPAELLVVVGPTGSGKTALAMALAERLDGEVVSADSVQIYRRFDLGSGKPTAAERDHVAHHCIDQIDPLDPMDAALFAELADGAIADITARGRRAIVCGGTFLWVRALLYGLAPAPPADPTVRQRHAAIVARDGRQALHDALAAVDPEAARRLAPNDVVRVSRALEVHEISGITLSAWQAAHGFRSIRYPARLIGIRHSSETLDHLIADRITAMLGAGWVQEVEALLADGLGEARPMRSVGYRQIADDLTGVRAPNDADLKTRIFRATRVFARRQRTWLRDQPVRWLTPPEAATLRPALVTELAAPAEYLEVPPG